MFGEHHPLSKPTGPPRVWKSFSLFDLSAIFLGAGLSWKLAELVPAIPVKNLVLAHLHHLTPLFLIALAFFVRHEPTGLKMGQYAMYWLAFKSRNKTFVWRR